MMRIADGRAVCGFSEVRGTPSLTKCGNFGRGGKRKTTHEWILVYEASIKDIKDSKSIFC